MAKKNTDTVPAMLTPGEFVIKKKSAKKIGYGKLNQMNKTGKVNTKKEAKMPQGKGTYGSKVGRPPKKAEGYQRGGKALPKRGKALPKRGARFPDSPRGRAGLKPGASKRAGQKELLKRHVKRLKEEGKGEWVSGEFRRAQPRTKVYGESDLYKVGE